MALVDGIEIVSWEDVYFPAEDTLLMLKSIVDGQGNFLDVGTGTGILGIGAALKGYSVVSTDIEMKCLLAARENASANSVALCLVRCDLVDALLGPFDIITFNPPYLPEEGHPDRQLTGGEQGFELALRLLSGVRERELLSAEGRVRIVLSSAGGIDRFVSAAANDWEIALRDSVKLDFETLHLLEAKPVRPITAPLP